MPILRWREFFFNMEVVAVGNGSLFMIEEIDSEKNTLLLADYIFNKRVTVPVTEKQISLYGNAFDLALKNNIYISVEYDENRGEIIG